MSIALTWTWRKELEGVRVMFHNITQFCVMIDARLSNLTSSPSNFRYPYYNSLYTIIIIIGF